MNNRGFVSGRGAVSLESAVMEALPKVSQAVKTRRKVGLVTLLRYEDIPYGVARRALECLEIMGVVKNVCGDEWVAV